MPHVWVIEIEDKKKWYPTPDCATTRERARSQKKWAKKLFPDDKFRVEKYIRKENN